MIKSSNLTKSVVVLAHNIRSSHNVGSLFRTFEGLGVSRLILSGYTPYPKLAKDKRLPHISASASRAISKTALGAENYLSWEQADNPQAIINRYKDEGYEVVALEQTNNSQDLSKTHLSSKVLLIIGSEVEGIDKQTLDLADLRVEIPMRGRKESFNVVQAAAMALYYILVLDS